MVFGSYCFSGENASAKCMILRILKSDGEVSELITFSMEHVRCLLLLIATPNEIVGSMDLESIPEYAEGKCTSECLYHLPILYLSLKLP